MKPFAFHGADASMRPFMQAVLDGEYAVKWFQLKGAPTILDVGANIGSYSYWAKSVWPAAKIHAYEANTANADHFRANMRDAGIKDVTLQVAAVYPTEEEKLTFYVGRYNNGMHSIDPGLAGQQKKSFEASVIHPKDLPACHILKMDIEGCEPKVLEAYLASHAGPDFVSFEYHSNADRKALDDMLYNNKDGTYFLCSSHIEKPDIGTLTYMHARIRNQWWETIRKILAAQKNG